MEEEEKRRWRAERRSAGCWQCCRKFERNTGPAHSGSTLLPFWDAYVACREMLDETVETARRRIHDIAAFQLPRLRACSSSLADHNQLSLELREDMDTVSRLVEELAVAIGDQQDEQARNELELAVNDMRDSLLQYAPHFASPSPSHWATTSTGCEETLVLRCWRLKRL